MLSKWFGGVAYKNIDTATGQKNEKWVQRRIKAGLVDGFGT